MIIKVVYKLKLLFCFSFGILLINVLIDIITKKVEINPHIEKNNERDLLYFSWYRCGIDGIISVAIPWERKDAKYLVDIEKSGKTTENQKTLEG